MSATAFSHRAASLHALHIRRGDESCVWRDKFHIQRPSLFDYRGERGLRGHKVGLQVLAMGHPETAKLRITSWSVEQDVWSPTLDQQAC